MVELDGFSRVLLQAVMVLVPMLLSLTVHEYAHAWAAKRLGDDTAERLGRLTLNPLAHADPVGTFLLPLMIMVASASAGAAIPFFGWAKPVPVDPRQFTRTKRLRTGMMLTAAAGPLCNLAMAFICAAILALAQHAGFVARIPAPLVILLHYMLATNIGLFVFNMVPIYPLDGQKVLAGLLTGPTAQKFEVLNYRFGWMALMFVIFFASDLLAKPVFLVEMGLSALFGLG